MFIIYVKCFFFTTLPVNTALNVSLSQPVQTEQLYCPVAPAPAHSVSPVTVTKALLIDAS